jgi:transposase
MKNNARKYTDSFRKESVEYLIQSGKSCKAVAKELGVSDVSLRDWSRRFAGDPSIKTPDPDKLSPAELLRELKRVQEENRYLKRQREILKKAMSIISEEPNGGMR